MKAMVQILAASVGESGFGRLWSKAGDLLDVVIPIAVFLAVVIGGSAVVFGLV
jgi:hypothetical protein